MIWQRYLFKQIIPLFLLIIFSLLFLYVFIDYSTHGKAFTGVPLHAIALSYLYQFSTQAPILLTLALLLTTIKVLTSLSHRREIVALASAGISLKKLSQPFIFLALLCMGLLYANFEWLEPVAEVKLEAFKSEHLKKEHLSMPHQLQLQDGSCLFYNRCDFEGQMLYDLFWVKNLDLIYHCTTLDLRSFEATDVRLIERDGEGLHFTKSEEKKSLEIFGFKRESLLPLCLSKGVQQKKWCPRIYYQLSVPLAALFFTLAVIPFSMRFARRQPTFLIYTFSLFALICYFTIVSSSVILGESGLIAPAPAVLSFPLFFGALTLKSYAKL